MSLIGGPETQLHGEAPKPHGRRKKGEVGAFSSTPKPRYTLQAPDVRFSDRDAVYIHRLGLYNMGVCGLSAELRVRKDSSCVKLLLKRGRNASSQMDRLHREEGLEQGV